MDEEWHRSLERVPKLLHPLLHAAAALYVYGTRVERERDGISKSAAGKMAGRVTSDLYVLLYMFQMAQDTAHMSRMIACNIVEWEQVVGNISTWKSFCGKTHAVPTDMVKAFATEVAKLRALYPSTQRPAENGE